MRFGRVVLVLVAILVVGLVGFGAYAYRPEIAAVATPDPKAFDRTLVGKGETLAALGNCNVCHTAEGGETFAGGLSIPTPFGAIYSTNITPDRETGIGTWSEAAFRRALRQGVYREGRHLYPAFPYDHYTLLGDEDARALYAYLMSRPAVRATAPENELRFPFGFRPLLAGWKLLFLKEGPYRPDSAKSAEWNRGAYLVEGAGHCGSCHTPRNAFGAEDRSAHLGGAPVEGWYAYAINAASPAPVAWTVDSLSAFLKEGFHGSHGMARGPMAPVVGNTGTLPDADLRAMAVYLVSLMDSGGRRPGQPAAPAAPPASNGERPQSGDSLTVAAAAADSGPGAAVYAAACASCHESGRPVPFGGLNLSLSTAVHGPNPKNIINVVLYGIPQAEGQASGMMPGFAGVMADRQLADLLAYLRSRFAGGRPAWDGVDALIRESRSGAGGLRIYAADGTAHVPADVNQKAVPQ